MFNRDFIRLLEESVGTETARTVLEALETEPSVSIRLNPSRLSECPFPDAVQIPWSPYGYLLRERPSFTMDPLFHAGCYYVQDSSAMLVGELARRVLDRFTPGMTALDLCAAPGGKTTDLAASLRERFRGAFSLLANEVMRSRYGLLRSNVRTWGDPQVGIVSRDPGAFSGARFDLVLADVPCSGEGMFRKDGKAVADWSAETVSFCAARQRRILSDIWPSLAEGGILIYSTCTFNHLENDDNVAWAMRELGAGLIDLGDFPSVERTRHGYALLPGFVPGEGQYAAVLVKEGTPDLLRRGDIFAAFHAERPVSPEPGYPCYDLDHGTALRYLHGDAVTLPDAPLCLLTLTYQGHPLGAGKNLGSRCNNLYPKDRRIRMDIR